MVFVAVMAFNGLTMATPVSAYSYKDVGSKISGNELDQYICSWHLVYYNSKHCTFYINKRHKVLYEHGHYDMYGKYIYEPEWRTGTLVVEKVAFKRVNKNHVRVTITTNIYGDVTSTSYTKKTSLTPYKFFKTKKNNIIKSVMSIY